MRRTGLRPADMRQFRQPEQLGTQRQVMETMRRSPCSMRLPVASRHSAPSHEVSDASPRHRHHNGRLPRLGNELHRQQGRRLADRRAAALLWDDALRADRAGGLPLALSNAAAAIAARRRLLPDRRRQLCHLLCRLARRDGLHRRDRQPDRASFHHDPVDRDARRKDPLAARSRHGADPLRHLAGDLEPQRRYCLERADVRRALLGCRLARRHIDEADRGRAGLAIPSLGGLERDPAARPSVGLFRERTGLDHPCRRTGSSSAASPSRRWSSR